MKISMRDYLNTNFSLKLGTSVNEWELTGCRRASTPGSFHYQICKTICNRSASQKYQTLFKITKLKHLQTLSLWTIMLAHIYSSWRKDSTMNYEIVTKILNYKWWKYFACRGQSIGICSPFLLFMFINVSFMWITIVRQS